MRSATPTLFVAGADEFAPDHPTPDPKTPKISPDVVRAIYAVAPCPTVGYASPKAADWFGGTLPPNFLLVDKVVSRVVRVGGLSVAVILFPQAPRQPDAVPPKLVDDILRTARQIKKERGPVDLVVGVSPWGFAREAKALPELSTELDVLLGAGEGAPFPVEQTAFAPGILWSRADRDGRCVVEMYFVTLPDRNNPRPLLRDVDFSVKEYPLGMDVPADPTVEKLLMP